MSAFIPGFEDDVFISYAHVDNQASGWVTSLEECLRNKLSELIGTGASIWRDSKLAGNDYFDDVITQRVKKAAVFVAVITPRYVESESCRKEYRAFVSGARGVRIGEKSRIIRVRKTPLPVGTVEPSDLLAAETLSFPFFEEKKGGELIDFENIPNMEGYQQFWNGLKGLARAIDKVLRLLKSDAQPSGGKRTVFLGETTRALAASRDELRREITGRGHHVVPEESLLADGIFDAAAAQELLASSSLAIHLFGGTYGVIPEGQEHSVPHIEYTLVSQRAIPQLVWIAPEPSGGPPVDAKLKALLDQVEQTEPAARMVLEVCKTEFENFKEVVLDALAKDCDPVPTITECKSVYLLCHDADIDSTDLRALKKHLLDAGYPVNLPAFEAPQDELRKIEEKSFLENDATLIYYGNASDSWVEQKRKFLLSALASAQQGAQNRRALCLRPPSTKFKELKFGDFAGGKLLPEAKGFSPLLVVGDFEALSAEKLKPLLEWLSK
jgi:hypothetical protein